MTTILDRFLQRRDRLRARENRTVLDALSDGYCFHAYELSWQTRLRAGRLFPALTRLLDRGLIEDGWEDETVTRAEGRPPRRWYRITGPGRYALTMEESP